MKEDTENIIQLAHSMGISSKIGFTTADDFAYLEKSSRLAVEEGRNSEFESTEYWKERIQPKLSLSSTKTIISVLLSPTPTNSSSNLKQPIKGKFAQQLGIRLPLCPSRQAQPAAAGIEEMTQVFEYKGMVDARHWLIRLS